MGAGDLPAARASCPAGWRPRTILKKLNLLRVPVEVELEGLDMAEYRNRLLPGARSSTRDDRRARRVTLTLIRASCYRARIAALTNGRGPETKIEAGV